MNYDEARLAAEICRRYARAVDTHLYMSMSTTQALEAITVANKIANVIDEFADTLDTISPADSE